MRVKVALAVTGLAVILLTGCDLLKQKDYRNIYVMVSEDKETYTYTDGTYVFTQPKASGSSITGKALLQEDITPCMYTMDTGTQYSMERVRPATYKMTYQSFCGYINNLKEKGYVEVSREADSTFMDIVLESADGKVRAIYGKDYSNIFCQDNSGNFYEPAQ